MYADTREYGERIYIQTAWHRRGATPAMHIARVCRMNTHVRGYMQIRRTNMHSNGMAHGGSTHTRGNIHCGVLSGVSAASRKCARNILYTSRLRVLRRTRRRARWRSSDDNAPCSRVLWPDGRKVARYAASSLRSRSIVVSSVRTRRARAVCSARSASPHRLRRRRDRVAAWARARCPHVARTMRMRLVFTSFASREVVFRAMRLRRASERFDSARSAAVAVARTARARRATERFDLARSAAVAAARVVRMRTRSAIGITHGGRYTPASSSASVTRTRTARVRERGAMQSSLVRRSDGRRARLVGLPGGRRGLDARGRSGVDGQTTPHGAPSSSTTKGKRARLATNVVCTNAYQRERRQPHQTTDMIREYAMHKTNNPRRKCRRGPIR